MYQVDSATAATTLPTPAAVGPNPGGFFTNGNPGTVPATVVDQDIMNLPSPSRRAEPTRHQQARGLSDYAELAAAEPAADQRLHHPRPVRRALEAEPVVTSRRGILFQRSVAPLP
jgi:hypothetical protein